jgi:hypothetical protein
MPDASDCALATAPTALAQIAAVSAVAIVSRMWKREWEVAVRILLEQSGSRWIEFDDLVIVGEP